MSTTRSTIRGVIVAALKAHEDISTTAVFYGRLPPPNYADQVWIVQDRPKTLELKANNLVLRGYPFEIEFRGTETADVGDELTDMVDAALEIVEDLFDLKIAGDFPSLAGLERVRVQELSTDERPAREDDTDDEIRARALVTFSMWEAP